MSPADPTPTIFNGEGKPIAVGAANIKNVMLNSMVAAVDQIVCDGTNDPAMQMGVLMLAQALAFRRLRHAHKIEGPRRRMILKKAVADFEEKIRKFGYDDPPEIDSYHKL